MVPAAERVPVRPRYSSEKATAQFVPFSPISKRMIRYLLGFLTQPTVATRSELRLRSGLARRNSPVRVVFRLPGANHRPEVGMTGAAVAAVDPAFGESAPRIVRGIVTANFAGA